MTRSAGTQDTGLPTRVSRLTKGKWQGLSLAMLLTPVAPTVGLPSRRRKWIHEHVSTRTVVRAPTGLAPPPTYFISNNSTMFPFGSNTIMFRDSPVPEVRGANSTSNPAACSFA
jgi:hypothetical protein